MLLLLPPSTIFDSPDLSLVCEIGYKTTDISILEWKWIWVITIDRKIGKMIEYVCDEKIFHVIVWIFLICNFYPIGYFHTYYPAHFYVRKKLAKIVWFWEPGDTSKSNIKKLGKRFSKEDDFSSRCHILIIQLRWSELIPVFQQKLFVCRTKDSSILGRMNLHQTFLTHVLTRNTTQLSWGPYN